MNPLNPVVNSQSNVFETDFDKKWPKNLTCGICLGPFENPYLICAIKRCFHTYCYKCIELVATKGNKQCPLCKDPFTLGEIFPNRVIQGTVEELREKIFPSAPQLVKMHEGVIETRTKPLPDRPIPLVNAAKKGDVALIKKLLQEGANIDEENEKSNRALFIAMGSGHIEVMKVLLENKASVDNPNGAGETPLILACAAGKLEMVDLLLVHFAKINLCNLKNGASPLGYAAQEGHTAIMKLLLANGAEVDSRNSDGDTPLTIAIYWNQFEAVKLLLEWGASVNHVSNNGETPLDEAMRQGNSKIIDLLKKNRAPSKKDVSSAPKISVKSRIFNQNFYMELDTNKLIEIFGEKPSVGIKNHMKEKMHESDTLIKMTGAFFDIKTSKSKETYRVCPSKFEKEIDNKVISGDGYFSGPWDEPGEKLAQLFFSNLRDGAIVYINGKKFCIHRHSGTIAFLSQREPQPSIEPLSQIELNKLIEIFGHCSGCSFTCSNICNGQNEIEISGARINEIKDLNGETYRFCLSPITKRITKICYSKGLKQDEDSIIIKADGYFEGPWDEKAKKLVQFFFSKGYENSMILINGHQFCPGENPDFTSEYFVRAPF